MNTRNLLRPGDYVSFIPAGVQLVLQYNESGNIEHVYTVVGANRTLCDGSVLTTLLNNHVVPGVIPVKKGTSWIHGVLYTGQLFGDTGELPSVLYNSLLSLLLKNPSQFNFFAINIESTAVTFTGASPTRQCLSNYKFKTLPGWIVPSNFQDSVADAWVNNEQYPFNESMTVGLGVFRKGEFLLYTLGMKQVVVSRVQKYVDVNGYIKARVTCDNGDTFSTDYSNVITYDLQPKTTCVFNAARQIVYSFTTDTKKRTPRTKTIICTYCGKSLTVPASGDVQCLNPHCTSKMVPNLMHFCSVLGISINGLDADAFAKLVVAKKITCLTDIFMLPELLHLDNIQASLATVLRAVVPIAVIPSGDIFTLLANRCSNNERTFRYYITNPEQIQTDLEVLHPHLHTLVNWLSDGCNLSDVLAVLDLPNIVIQQIDKKFDGAPIFRGRKFFITGDFIHGNISEIIAILQSYSATVITQFDDTVSGVLVGDKHENIDGTSINAARNLNIPIMFESDFFHRYAIEEDLQANLVYSNN